MIHLLHTTLGALAGSGALILALDRVELVAQGEYGFACVEIVILYDAVVARAQHHIVAARVEQVGTLKLYGEGIVKE